jgi:hypothetical protein
VTRSISSSNTTLGSSSQPRVGYGAIVLNFAGSSQPDGVLRTLLRPASYASLLCGRTISRVTLALTVFWTSDYGTKNAAECTEPFNVSIHRLLTAPASVTNATWATMPGAAGGHYDAASPLVTFVVPPPSALEGTFPRINVTSVAMADDANAWARNSTSAWIMTTTASTRSCFFELLTVGSTASTIIMEAVANETGAPRTCGPTAAPTTTPTTTAPTSAPTSEPTATPTTAVPTSAPTSEPTATPTTAAPTSAPTSAPSSSPTHTPTVKAATVDVVQSQTTAVSPPESDLTMRFVSSIDLQLTVRTLSEAERVESEAVCGNLTTAGLLGVYEITSNATAGSFAVNLTVEALDKPYGTDDRNVYLCLDGTWTPTADVCRALNITAIANSSPDPDHRTFVATLCHFSTYLVAEYNNATRTCASSKYGCLCTSDGRMSDYGIVAVSGAVVFVAARLFAAFRWPPRWWKLLLKLLQLAGAVVLAAGLLVDLWTWELDPDARVGNVAATAAVAPLFALAGALALARLCLTASNVNDTSEYTPSKRNRAIPLLSGVSVACICAATGVVAIGVAGEPFHLWWLVALSVVSGAFAILDGIFGSPRGALAPSDTLDWASVIRVILRALWAIAFAFLAFAASVRPCDRLYKGPV